MFTCGVFIINWDLFERKKNKHCERLKLKWRSPEIVHNRLLFNRFDWIQRRNWRQQKQKKRLIVDTVPFATGVWRFVLTPENPPFYNKLRAISQLKVRLIVKWILNHCRRITFKSITARYNYIKWPIKNCTHPPEMIGSRSCHHTRQR